MPKPASLILFALISIGLFAYLYKIDKQTTPNFFEEQTYSIGKAVLRDNYERTTRLKIEHDYYQCLDSARLFYELTWKGHCSDQGKEEYCNFEDDLQENMRFFYQREKVECFSARSEWEKTFAEELENY